MHWRLYHFKLQIWKLALVYQSRYSFYFAFCFLLFSCLWQKHSKNQTQQTIVRCFALCDTPKKNTLQRFHENPSTIPNISKQPFFRKNWTLKTKICWNIKKTIEIDVFIFGGLMIFLYNSIPILLGLLWPMGTITIRYGHVWSFFGKSNRDMWRNW